MKALVTDRQQFNNGQNKSPKTPELRALTRSSRSSLGKETRNGNHRGTSWPWTQADKLVLTEYLSSLEERYDAKLHLLGNAFHSPGYHSTLPDGTWAHSTRDSFGYALDLLSDGSAVHVARACDVLRAAIALQDQDQTSPTYGIWSWLYEEPLSKMSPPDWNWADFCGLKLSEIYLLHKKSLPVDVRALILAGLGHAAASIYRRNMGPHYTNISIMGAIVTTLAGEISGDERWLSYGCARFQKCVDHFQLHGGYNEYNSPTYTWVVARDCERALRLIRGREARRLATFLWRAAWQTIAEHFHPPTGQLGGPQSRSYTTFLSPDFVNWLAIRTGLPLQPYSLKGALTHHENSYEDPFFLPCPKDLKGYFRRVPEKPYEIKRRFVKRPRETDSIWGTTWFSGHACLGSVNGDLSWDQRRAVLAYWVGDANKPVCARLRILHDHREFASSYVVNQQLGPKVLSGIYFLLDRGDFHPIWGGPPDNVFQAVDFRVGYEFKGENLQLQSLPDGRFVVSAGTCQAYVTPAPVLFGGVEIAWTARQEENSVHIEAILHQGKRKAFDFKTLFPIRIAAALEIDESTSAPKMAPLKWQEEDGQATASWATGNGPALKVSMPQRPVILRE